MLVGHEDMVDDEIDAQAEEDLVRGETIAMPLAFVALVVVFGGLLAAILPLALALAGVAGALVVLAAGDDDRRRRRVLDQRRDDVRHRPRASTTA